MIELRWLRRVHTNPWDNCKREEDILQYREQRQVSHYRYGDDPNSLSFTTVWSEWQDVPVVEDETDSG